MHWNPILTVHTYVVLLGTFPYTPIQYRHQTFTVIVLYYNTVQINSVLKCPGTISPTIHAARFLPEKCSKPAPTAASSFTMTLPFTDHRTRPNGRPISCNAPRSLTHLQKVRNFQSSKRILKDKKPVFFYAIAWVILVLSQDTSRLTARVSQGFRLPCSARLKTCIHFRTHTFVDISASYKRK